MLERIIRTLCALVIALPPLAGGCTTNKRDVLQAPSVVAAPYDTTRGEVLWAVVPLRNESGTSIVDVLTISDRVVEACAQVRGVRCLPLNRTIAAMRSLQMGEPQSPAEARQLAAQVGADAIIVGSITSYDPYNPPKFGLALALYARPGMMDRAAPDSIDTQKLTYQPTEYSYFPRSGFKNGEAPASVASVFLDGKNQQVQMDVKAYAEGRHDAVSALGWRRFLASMDLYTEFGAWYAVRRLLDHEWLRLARGPATEND